MKKTMSTLWWLLRICIGSALFALGFDLFLAPNNFNAGGLSGLAQIIVNVLGFGSVGIVSALINIPLFIVSGVRIGKKFFFGSLVGMLSSSGALELFELLPVPTAEPLLAALYGGVICGVGLGIVFMSGASTGGSDIIVRLLQRKWRHMPIGTISILFDVVVVLLTGLVTMDMSKALYTGIVVFLTGKIIDLVVYSFDYSKVVLIISSEHEAIAQDIFDKLDRGVTYLHGEGGYKRDDKLVILAALKKHQVPDLKELVSMRDPNAFVIVQEAHQVLGDGFSHYTKDSL